MVDSQASQAILKTNYQRPYFLTEILSGVARGGGKKIVRPHQQNLLKMN